tara:strand:+ start:7371 stop:7898 length:528 start_codon:yes stop_codon:yes gene_type:complete
MATNTTSSSVIATQWSKAETDSIQPANQVVDNGQLTNFSNYASGTGVGEIDTIYHDIQVFTSSSTLKRYYLFSGLDQGILDSTGTVKFSRIKSLTIKATTNTAKNMGVQFGNSSSSGWSNFQADAIGVRPSGMFHWGVGIGTGIAVTSDNQEIALQPLTVGTGTLVAEILIMGVA